MSPSFAPASMNAAITSVYAVIASCTPWMVVSRSETISEIATFMTLLSSTITNCAEPRIASGNHTDRPAPDSTCSSYVPETTRGGVRPYCDAFGVHAPANASRLFGLLFLSTVASVAAQGVVAAGDVRNVLITALAAASLLLALRAAELRQPLFALAVAGALA